MNRLTAFLVCLLFVSTATCGRSQTTGVPGYNDFTINGAGSGTTSITPVILQPGPQVIHFAASVGPGDRILLIAGAPAPGLVPWAGGQSQDVDLSVGVIYDSYAPSGLGPSFPFSTGSNSNGDWALTISADLPAMTLGLQLVLASPASPSPFLFCQAYALVVPDVLHPSTVGGDLPLSDNGSVLVSLTPTDTPSTNFSFYGVSYSDVWVNMNGNLTFGSPDSDFTPSSSEMLSGPPRIAPLWVNLEPSLGLVASVRKFVGSTFVLSWTNVPLNNCPWWLNNTFSLTLSMTTNGILFEYCKMNLCGLSPLVGISPGYGLSGPNNVDLYVGGLTTRTGPGAIYEDFSGSGPFDLGVLSCSSPRTSHFISSGGAAPYTCATF